MRLYFFRLVFEVIDVGIVKDFNLSLEDNSGKFFQKAMRMLKQLLKLYLTNKLKNTGMILSTAIINGLMLHQMIITDMQIWCVIEHGLAFDALTEKEN